MENYTVKAREHPGTNSLDLTLPAKITKKYNLSKGDIFKVEVLEENDTLIIKYTLIYQQNKRGD